MKYGNRLSWFEQKYKLSPSGCWEWVAARDSRGYGRFGLDNGKTILAHRYSWEIYKGPIPPGGHICHRCDNPPCVRPGHLFLGSALLNQRDSMKKGRKTNPPIHSGETHHKAKLTLKKVSAIRKAYSSKGVSQRKLAKEYGISQTVIGRVVRFELWRNV